MILVSATAFQFSPVDMPEDDLSLLALMIFISTVGVLIFGYVNKWCVDQLGIICPTCNQCDWDSKSMDKATFGEDYTLLTCNVCRHQVELEKALKSDEYVKRIDGDNDDN